MKKLVSVLLSSLILFSCKKNIPGNVNDTLPSGTVVSSGTFVGNSHSTSGSVKIVVNSGGKKFLVVENFRTDNGPDLRVWLSPNNNASPYQEAGTLKAISGNFFYELGNSIDHTSNNRVLIWCEDFSVLFGHAILN